MSNLKIINEKKNNLFFYIAGYKNKEVGIYAADLYAAKKEAIIWFKPTKKDIGLLWVELATN